MYSHSECYDFGLSKVGVSVSNFSSPNHYYKSWIVTIQHHISDMILFCLVYISEYPFVLSRCNMCYISIFAKCWDKVSVYFGSLAVINDITGYNTWQQQKLVNCTS